jgi:hypothetical protein
MKPATEWRRHMNYLNEVTNGYGVKHLEIISVGVTDGLYKMRVYGQLMLTPKGKERTFKTEEAANKAADVYIRQLRKQAEINRKAMLAL